MAIGDRIEVIRRLLDQVNESNRCVSAASFQLGTIDDLKNHTKGLADQAKDEIDEVKDEIDQW